MTAEVDLFSFCAAGNQSKLAEALETIQDTQSVIHMKNHEGKSLIEFACMFGRLEVIMDLAQYGFRLDQVSERGYTLAHWAATWGSLNVLRYLLSNSVDLFVKNVHGETAKDIAERYAQTECAGFLEKEELVRQLKRSATHYKEMFVDPEKNMGRFTKEDKSQGNKMCDAMVQWVEQNRETAHSEQVKGKIEELANQMEPYMSKLHS